MPTPINVSSGTKAILALGNVVSQADITGGNNAMILPYLQDITINNSTGVFRWKTLDNTAESVATTPATNSLAMNIVLVAQQIVLLEMVYLEPVKTKQKYSLK